MALFTISIAARGKLSGATTMQLLSYLHRPWLRTWDWYSLGGHTITSDQRGSLVALDLETGEKSWEYATIEPIFATPLYLADKHLLATDSNDKKVFSLDARDGRLKWQFEMKGEIKSGLAWDVRRNQIVTASFDWNCYGIDIDSGEGKTLLKGNHAFYNTPLVVDDKLFVGSCGKALYVYDLQEAYILRKLRTFGRIMSHPTFNRGQSVFRMQ